MPLGQPTAGFTVAQQWKLMKGKISSGLMCSWWENCAGTSNLFLKRWFKRLNHITLQSRLFWRWLQALDSMQPTLPLPYQHPQFSPQSILPKCYLGGRHLDNLKHALIHYTVYTKWLHHVLSYDLGLVLWFRLLIGEIDILYTTVHNNIIYSSVQYFHVC